MASSARIRKDQIDSVAALNEIESSASEESENEEMADILDDSTSPDNAPEGISVEPKQNYDKLTKGQIRSMLADGKLKAVKKSGVGVTSSMWTSFLDILDQNGESINYAQFQKWKSCLRIGSKAGTSSCLRHTTTSQGTVSAAAGTPPITQFVVHQNRTKKSSNVKNQ